MLYMVVERFQYGPAPVYQRAREQGRMLPSGLRYVDSWIDAATRERCFQLMETDDRALLDEWAARWVDLVEFEFIPVISSAAAAGSERPEPEPPGPPG
jgi:Protein of unknown function (DUF3303)